MEGKECDRKEQKIRVSWDRERAQEAKGKENKREIRKIRAG